MEPQGHSSIVRHLAAEADLEAATAPSQSMRTGQAAAAYFAVMLALGLVLSPLRDLAVRSGTDPVFAFLTQAVVTLFALTWAAGWVAGAFSVPADVVRRLGLGFGAVGALVATELVAHFLRAAVTPLDLAARIGRPEGGIVLGALLFSALLPALRNSTES